jgi:phage terminase small subunit
MERKLTPKQHAFVLGYLETGNASEAYRRAYDVRNMLPSTVNEKACLMLKDVRIRARVDDLQQQSAQAAVMDRAATLRLITEIATADATQLVEVQVRNCRHCWGVGHHYQWSTGIEYAFAVAEVNDENARTLNRHQAIASASGNKKVPQATLKELPTDEGGYGFDVKREPNPECPKCNGDGLETVRVRDTRKLTGSAKRLFAGAKKTKHGIEISTRNQAHALDLLAKANKIVGDAPTVAMQVNAPGGTVQTVVASDPLEAARQYQELMKG